MYLPTSEGGQSSFPCLHTDDRVTSRPDASEANGTLWYPEFSAGEEVFILRKPGEPDGLMIKGVRGAFAQSALMWILSYLQGELSEASSNA